MFLLNVDLPTFDNVEKTENTVAKFSDALRRTDIVRSKNIVRSLETSHFVENCLCYNSTWFKQTFVVGL